ncbi:MAG: glutamate--tRNA ligase [Chloroflexota bacterium]
MTEKARTRYAPSPTGRPHIGNIRTAVFSYLLAKHTGGDFLLRIEDTDRKRYVEGSLEAIEDSLRWLGLDWDEGPGIGGPYEPYLQSERLELYLKYATQLVAEGKAYYSYDRERTEEERKAAEKNPQVSLSFSRRWRESTEEERQAAIADGIKPVIRFKVPLEGVTTVPDIVVNPPIVQNSSLSDLVLLKSDGFPTYHLAHIVDDHLMKITHVIRGQEWLPSAALHVLLYQALGWEMPVMVHPPVILNPPGVKGKLSKRESAVYVGQYRELGYLPEALLNYLVLLGWSYDDKTELFSKEELIEKFDLNRIQPTPAKYSVEKLDWLNAYYINHKLTREEFAQRSLPFLAEAGLITQDEVADLGERLGFIVRVCGLVKDKVKILSEVPGEIDFMFKPASELEYPAQDLVGKNESKAATAKILAASIDYLAKLPDEKFTTAGIAEGLSQLSADLELKNRGLLFWPVRIAMCGRKNSPDASAMIETYGREAALDHLRVACEKLG